MIIDVESIYSFHQLGERDNQEDSRFPDVDLPDINNATFVVCDGVGGCDKGEVASSAVCARIGVLTAKHKNSDEFTENDFKSVLNQAYKSLDDISDPSNIGMGTTLAFAILHSNGVLAAHIGDSRIYHIRPGEGILYRSEDHTLVNSLLRSGNISPDKLRSHPQRNIITRCMSANDGTRKRDDATVINLRDIIKGDYLLLCSDGVINVVEEEELIEIYSTSLTDKDKYEYLAEKCKVSSDNNTLIQIHISSVIKDNKGDTEEESNSLEIEDSTTQKLSAKEDSVHELGVSDNKKRSILKSLYNIIFK